MPSVKRAHAVCLALVAGLASACVANIEGNNPPGDLAVPTSAGGAGGTGTVPGIGGSPAVVRPEPLASELLHRLNRLEYNNTVRDLLGTSLSPADAFPP